MSLPHDDPEWRESFKKALTMKLAKDLLGVSVDTPEAADAALADAGYDGLTVKFGVDDE